MQINLTRAEILELASKNTNENDPNLINRLGAAGKRGYLSWHDLHAAATWKWRGPRTRQLCGENSEAEVYEITRVSFAAKSERLRIGALLSLRGLSWPMASVILHFTFKEYPILDVKAMKAVGGSTTYNFENWMKYTELCRAIAAKHVVSMRTLDRALWQVGTES